MRKAFNKPNPNIRYDVFLRGGGRQWFSQRYKTEYPAKKRCEALNRTYRYKGYKAEIEVVTISEQEAK